MPAATRRLLLPLALLLPSGVHAQNHVLLGAPAPSGVAPVYAYDATRGRVIMALGSSAGHDGTFEWDGARWLARRSPVRPQFQYGCALAFDRARGRLVLHGGYRNPFQTTPVGTWEWDGHEWRSIATAVAPSDRWEHAMAYDTARGCCVLFGGATAPNHTWEYDGVTWQQRAPSTSPPPMSRNAMAYDPLRQRTVMYGNSAGGSQLWEWNGVDWTNVTPPSLPADQYPAITFDPARGNVVLLLDGDLWSWDGSALQLADPSAPLYHCIAYNETAGRLLTGDERHTFGSTASGFVLLAEHGPMRCRRMVFDPVRQRAVAYSNWFMFYNPVGPAITFVEGTTQEWDGYRWLAMPPGPARRDPLVTYDPVHGGLLAHGGGTTTATFDETWRWSGTQWANVTGSVRPSGDTAGSIAADRARQQVILLTSSQQTWSWNGSMWTQLFPAHDPGPRFGATLVEDALRQRLVLFGGAVLAGPAASETWEWDGGDWLLVASPSAPAPRRLALGFFDDSRARVVMHGGVTPSGGSALADTWEWDGASWVPAARALSGGGVAAYLPHTGQLLLGDAIEGPLLAASSRAIGDGCGGVAAPPRLHTNTPFLGVPSLRVEVAGLAANAPSFLGFSFAATSLPIGCGCTVHLADPIGLIPLVGTATGNARFEMAVPAVSWLRGLEVHAQALALDPAGACAPVALTGAVALRFGD